MRILLAEDNDDSRDMLTRRLMRRGYDIIEARDGDEVLALAEQTAPDVILMDISLPGVDGLEATRRLKLNACTSHIPIIALTAHAMHGDRERAIGAGCNDYDTKPIDLPRLLGKIEAVVSGGN